jgi:hypothetical protein
VLRIGPSDWGVWDDGVQEATEPGLETQSSNSPGLRTQATVQRGTNEPFEANGWTLLSYALQSCLPSEAPFYVTHVPWIADSGNFRNFYMFQRLVVGSPSFPYKTCDDTLMLEEVLLCGADRLAQVADSVGTVTWDSADIPDPNNPGSTTAITVTIPPQDTDDKFIARDLALNALAHIAQLETKERFRPFQGTEEMRSCALDFAALAAGAWTDFGVTSAPNVKPFGVGYYFDDPTNIDFSNASTDVLKAAGARRLGRYATVLASAGRLLKDLVERSVRDDMTTSREHSRPWRRRPTVVEPPAAPGAWTKARSRTIRSGTRSASCSVDWRLARK